MSALKNFSLLAASLAAFSMPSPSEQLLVNKHHPLQPTTYTPVVLLAPNVPLATSPDDIEMTLIPDASNHLQQLFIAASQAGFSLVLSSGYRSYAMQADLYAASAGSLRSSDVAAPGVSEHQTGLAADLVLSNNFCPAQTCFAFSRAADWLAIHAPQYGFVLRYPLHKEAITGYPYEPWHFRYVGKPLAEQLQTTGETLEEYYRTN